MHGAGAREERAQRRAEEDEVLLGRHLGHVCCAVRFPTIAELLKTASDWSMVSSSNQITAKPGAQTFLMHFCTRAAIAKCSTRSTVLPIEACSGPQCVASPPRRPSSSRRLCGPRSTARRRRTTSRRPVSHSCSSLWADMWR